MSTDLIVPDEIDNSEIVVKRAEDHRTDAVAHLLASAYDKASTLQLSKEEAQALAEDFPDDAFRLGAGGKPDLLYIEHAFLRERMNLVLGVGAAVPVVRRVWTEEYEYTDKYKKKQTAVRIYVESVLLVRGCVVGEAIGDGVYYKSNGANTYSDAIESAKSNALRRCCKEFGVGLQVWKKGFVEGWKSRHGGRRPQSAPPAKPAPPAKAAEKPTVELPPAPRLTADTDLGAWERHEAAAYIAHCRTSGELLELLNRMAACTEWAANMEDWPWLCKLITEAYRLILKHKPEEVNDEFVFQMKKHAEAINNMANDPFAHPQGVENEPVPQSN